MKVSGGTSTLVDRHISGSAHVPDLPFLEKIQKRLTKLSQPPLRSQI